MDNCHSSNITKLKIQTLLGFNDFFKKTFGSKKKTGLIFRFFFSSVNLPSFQYHEVEEERKLAWDHYLINAECFLQI